MIIINLLIITTIICFIVDLSGFIQEMEGILSKWLKFKVHIPKPFSCSLCLSFWINLIYLLIIHQFTLPYILIVSLLSFLSRNISGFMLWVRELLVKIETLLYKLIR